MYVNSGIKPRYWVNRVSAKEIGLYPKYIWQIALVVVLLNTKTLKEHE